MLFRSQTQAFPAWADFWMPRSFIEPELRNRRKYHPLEVVARLKPGVDLNQAEADVQNVARQLAQVAGSLILVARRQDRLRTLELELKLINPELEIFIQQVDLQNEEEVSRFCDWLEESGLTVDVLINNAGLGDYGKFGDADWQRIRAMLQVNMVALTYLTYRILPAMRKGGGDRKSVV